MNTQEQVEYMQDIQMAYLGRVEFGKGKIDATEVTREEFESNISFAARECVIFVPDFRQRYGGCMDGRGNVQTAAGTAVVPRPKVIGGPSLFAWNVAAVGGFSVIDGVTDPLKQFEIVNRKLLEAGFHLGMHEECGAARGAQPVLENLIETYDNINGLLGVRAAKEAARLGDLSGILNGAKQTAVMLGHADNFTEENMLRIISELDGPEAVLHLAVDHSHDTHGHEEDGLVFVDIENGVVFKDKFIEATGEQNFWQNQRYARSIAQALARTQSEYARGIIVGDQLALGGVITLGLNQHVGQLLDSQAA